MEGLDGERPLQTGEVVIIVVVLLMWAGESWMGNRGLGSVTVGSGEGCLSVRRKGREREGGRGRLAVGGNQDRFARPGLHRHQGLKDFLGVV